MFLKSLLKGPKFCMLWYLLFNIVLFHLSCAETSFLNSDCTPEKNYVSLMMSTVTQDSSPETCSASSTAVTIENEKPSLSDSKALAVVLYNEENLLPHEKKNRSFHLNGHEFHIEQNWHLGGVAAVVWDAAVVLGEFLASQSGTLKGKRVLELGAGTGLAGMVAASLGANVVVTERQEAMTFLQAAVDRNEADKRWSIEAEVLDWTQDVNVAKFGGFDFVIGADIVYIESIFQDLLKTLKSVAATPKTKILLSCRIRYKRDLKFLHMLKKFYTVEEVLYNSEMDIKIFSALTRS